MSKVNLDKEKLVSETLQKLGVPCHLKGFNYIKDAVVLVLDEPKLMSKVTDVLYPKIAKKHEGATGSKVERNIRHAIEITLNEHCEPNILEEVLGKGIGIGKMTNSRFIATLAERLRLELKQKAS